MISLAGLEQAIARSAPIAALICCGESWRPLEVSNGHCEASRHVRVTPESGHPSAQLGCQICRPIARVTAFAYRRALSHRSPKMSVEGLILHHGKAHGVTLHQTRIDYLVTAEHSKQCSLFEFTIAPGFNTGAHYHTKIEEIFYVLEGELDLRCGEQTVRGGPGTCVFVPPGAPHGSETLVRRQEGCS
jgi:quercetin dioxygenase-like cupin family protein